MKYFKFMFYGFVAMLAIIFAEKRGVGELVKNNGTQRLLGIESVYADTTTSTAPAPVDNSATDSVGGDGGDGG